MSDNILKIHQNKYYRILQCASGHTGSTLLVNLITGFFRPDEKIYWNSEAYINTKFITKTHFTNIDEWILEYSKYIKLFFVVSERENHKKIDVKYKNKEKYPNILFIDYTEILETETNNLETICKNIIVKFKNFFPKDIIPNLSDDQLFTNVYNRILNMNKRYKEIKDKDFSYLDDFYLLHGGHRNRVHVDPP